MAHDLSSGLVSHGSRSFTEDRLQIGKDLGKIQVGLCAHTEVAARSGIDRDDRLYPGLEIAPHPDDALMYRSGRPPRERPIEWRRRCEFNQGNPIPPGSGSRYGWHRYTGL